MCIRDRPSTTTEDVLENRIASFWEIEGITGKHMKSYEEQACEDHFTSTVKR